MKLIVNGNEENLEVTSLQEVVEAFNLQEGLVVTEIDGEIVDREKWESTKVSEGMKIEIVHFVGGG